MFPAGDDVTADSPLSAVTATGAVLLLAPAMSRGQDACPTVGPPPTDGSNLLVVLLSGSIESRLDRWLRNGGLPDDVYVICCEETRGTSSSRTARTTVRTVDDVEIPTRMVSSPDDLTDLGLAINRCLESLADGERVDVCFDSLTTLLHYVDVKRAFRFLHALTPGVRDSDGLAHFHMDPNAHDARTVAIVERLFDATYQYDEAGDEWLVD